ncbi:hypothetical protein [Salinivibrio sp. IB872]|jgi:Na+-transporting methylmalonyl-CoA/oxaloacetate decarboxylase gamma subunit|uniref:hypothetical protein n=1 Tax=Salinivibrio sp. IB872 TaxID=1766123 RepID=UPI0009850139|nr:hypothetical protein [Salinivibrio sp. IB872]OOF24829.1 hypothetical protein BZJ18_12990 [Salinivibrio sp. IB872]
MSDEKDIELEHLKLNVEVWKKIVDVQQHFNDLEMKVRNFGLLIVSAFISAIGVSLKSQYEAEVVGYNIPVASFLALGSFIVWMLVFLVDVYWYHPLLKGAVLKGIEMEEQIKSQLPNINLTGKIGEESAVSILKFKDVRSTTKAKIFYLGIGGVLLVLTILIFCMGEKAPDIGNTSTQSIPEKTESKINDMTSNLIKGEGKTSPAIPQDKSKKSSD